MESIAAGKTRLLVDRFLKHAGEVLCLVDDIPRHCVVKYSSSQLARSVTAIGANYEEAQAAESKNDFVHKLQIALKESRETCYWLRLIESSKVISPTRIDPIIRESLEIRAIIAKAVVTTKARYALRNI